MTIEIAGFIHAGTKRLQSCFKIVDGFRCFTDANFAFCRGLYSNVFRSSVRISFSPPLPFVFLKNPDLFYRQANYVSTIFCNQAGMINVFLASSFGQLS